MKRHWIGGLAGLLLALILVGCGAEGATGQVESLSPDELKKYTEDNNQAFILLNNTEDEKERKDNINLVEEQIKSISVKEINAKSEEMLDNNLKPDDLGLKDIQFETLGYYEDGTLEKYVSLRDVDYSSEDEKQKAIEKFIDETTS
ncbi:MULTISPECIES: hypothetical protein [Bacillaceae]|uniref:Lipoprotein n=2 Tax=Bacillaceae TaxID=186817 RepID=A0A059NZG6_9BACI|nr:MULTISPECIES: hypothetical protein [Bacillaceae]NIK29997.1 hypothetical protein [Thalassobacillus devorans]CDQ20325.1 hypothetical protein BN982_02654 [Halobacillus karajensis]CDQ23607.1 hypothetical protein BN983_01853 [Halobacillus karajensis]CDQ27086.1 hypothetical protein BN981_01335 [Halobacillus karajensis]GGC97522.1 hypothetical protein GCM10007216_30370 [Thalassobacillus devorans]